MKQPAGVCFLCKTAGLRRGPAEDGPCRLHGRGAAAVPRCRREPDRFVTQPQKRGLTAEAQRALSQHEVTILLSQHTHDPKAPPPCGSFHPLTQTSSRRLSPLSQGYSLSTSAYQGTLSSSQHVWLPEQHLPTATQSKTVRICFQATCFA